MSELNNKDNQSKTKRSKDEQQKEKLTAKQKREKERENAAREKKKTIKIAVLAAALIVLLLAVSLFINSNFIRRNITAITVGNRDFTVAEFNVVYFSYYYHFYNDMLTNYGDYASEMLPDTSKPLKSQKYDESTGETWAERMETYALDSLVQYVAWYDEAMAVGFELTEDDRAELQNDLEQIETSAVYYGYTDVNDYIRNLYGKGVNYDILKDVLEFIYTAEAYDQYYSDNLIYTDEQVHEQYLAKQDMYDQYDYRYMIVNAEEVKKSDYAADEEDKYNADKKAALEAVKSEAEDYYNRIKTEQDMIDIAKEYNSESYADRDSTLRSYTGSLLGSTYGVWMRDSAREPGDKYLVELASGTGYYIVYFIGRSDNHYETVNLKMIQIDPANVNADNYADEEDDTAYNEAVESAKEDAKVEAEELLQAWKDEGGTKDLFLQYIEDNNDSLYNDGIFDNVYKDQFEESINDWAYSASRKEGDTTVIYSEANNAYMILYYDGVGEYYNYYLARKDLHDNEYNAWVQEITENVEHKTTWVFALTKE